MAVTLGVSSESQFFVSEFIQVFSLVRSQPGSHHLSVLQQNHAAPQTQAEQTLHQRSVPLRPTEHTRLRQRGGHHGLRGWGEPLAPTRAAHAGPCCVSASIGSFLCVPASKREQLVNNLQSLSVSDRVRMLREMPLSVAEKSTLR